MSHLVMHPAKRGALDHWRQAGWILGSLICTGVGVSVHHWEWQQSVHVQQQTRRAVDNQSARRVLEHLDRARAAASLAVSYGRETPHPGLKTRNFSDRLPIWDTDPFNQGLLAYADGGIKPRCGQIGYTSMVVKPGRSLQVKLTVGVQCPGHPGEQAALHQLIPQPVLAVGE